MNVFDFGRVPPITFGAGRVSEVPKIVSTLGGGPVFLIADSFLADLGVAHQLEENIKAAGITCSLAADITGEPKELQIDALCSEARTVEAKTVVGLGGGAAMDAAKLVAAIAPSAASAETYALGATPLPSNGIPAVAIPTTAGTGSEVTRTSIISTETGAKNWYWAEELMFAHAVLDPTLTLSLPAHLTAWTGIDAIAHALEAVTSRKSNAVGRLYGLEALRLLAPALPRVVGNGDDLELRSQVLWGSTLAGLALHNCNTHIGHNISHALGSLSRVHHGLATGLALNATLPWLVARPEGAENYAAVAEALGGVALASALPSIFEDLMQTCEIPRQLPQACAGVDAVSLASAMKNAANRSMSQNAACALADADLDELANMVMALPLETAA